MRKTLLCIAGAGFVLVGCAKEEAPILSCPALRQAYNRAFELAVTEGAAKRFDRQERYISEGQEALLAMEKQGCCKEQNACPNLNVN